MKTVALRSLFVLLLLACAATVWFALSGTMAVGTAPVSPAPSVSAAGGAAPTSATSPATPGPRPATSASRPPSPAATPAVQPTVSAEPSVSEGPETSPEPDPTQEPGPAAEPTVTEVAAPTQEPPTTSAAPEPAPEPAPAGAETLMTGPAAPWEAITAAPVHVDVHQDGQLIVGAPVHHTQMDAAGDLDPEPRTVGWYGEPQWGTTPGERSPYAGILAGHVVYDGLKDVFWNLEDVRAGDVVVVTYGDGTQAAFEADADAVSVEKEALTQDPAHRWAWEPGGDDARVTLITCDLVPGTGLAGNAFNNWVVQATRVA